MRHYYTDGEPEPEDQSEPCLIMLDIDGVLRRNDSPMYELEAECREAFERAVRAIPQARIVVTSSWREGFTLEEIRSHFSADIASRIVGTTPIAEEWDESEPHRRHREVLAYLEERTAPGLRWLAIDDTPEHYPADAPLVVTDPEKGFDRDAAERLLYALQASRRS